jgi:MFS family permease
LRFIWCAFIHILVASEPGEIIPLYWYSSMAASLLWSCNGPYCNWACSWKYKPVNILHREYQATASGISQLMMNLLGFFLSPFLSSLLMDRFDDKSEGLIWGYRLSLWWSIFGLIYIGLAWMSLERRRPLQLENK